MRIMVKPSDLFYRYQKDTASRELPRFSGKPDRLPFNRDSLYEVVPMLEAVMSELGSDEGRILHMAEEIMNRDLPRFLTTREEAFDFLVGCTREILARR